MKRTKFIKDTRELIINGLKPFGFTESDFFEKEQILILRYDLNDSFQYRYFIRFLDKDKPFTHLELDISLRVKEVLEIFTTSKSYTEKYGDDHSPVLGTSLLEFKLPENADGFKNETFYRNEKFLIQKDNMLKVETYILDNYKRYFIKYVQETNSVKKIDDLLNGYYCQPTKIQK